MIVCAWLPHFALRVIAHRQGRGLDEALAVASAASAHPVVLDCTAAARADGVVPGMLVSRALGCCATLGVLDHDDARVEEAAERFLVRLEALGAAVQQVQPGRAFFDAAPLGRLCGGLEGVLARVHDAFARVSTGASPLDLRLGAAPSPFVAWVAARYARPGGHLAIEAGETRGRLAGMPLELLPADDRFLELMHALGLSTLGDLAAIDRAQIADRFGDEGLALHDLARGDDRRVLVPRRQVEVVEEELRFPEPAANLHALQRAVRVLVERAVARPRLATHAPRSVVVVALLSTGGSWRSRRVLRTATVDAARIATTAVVGLDEVPAPVEQLTVRLDELEPREVAQPQLLARRRTTIAGAGDGGDVAGGEAVAEALERGLRQVQSAAGDDAVLQVLEVEPGSRVPERHAVLVPRGQVGVGDRGPGGRAADAGRGVWR